MGVIEMQVVYDSEKDLLYLRLDRRPQQVENRRLSDDIVLDVGEDEKIVGIEILDASKQLNLETVLPVEYRETKKAV